MTDKQADVVVIGGITGTAILHELSKYNLRAVLVEQEPELAAGTTKAIVPFFTQVSMLHREA